MKWFNTIFYTAVLVLFFSCKKESENITLTAYNINESGAVYQIKFLNEQVGFACGGSIWTNGFIYKTTDGGNSWTNILKTNNIVYTLDFRAEDTITAGGFSGRIWQTTDSGNTWKLSELGPHYMPLKAIVYSSKDKVLFAMGFKYFIGGKGWFNTEIGTFSSNDEEIAMEDIYAFTENEVIYCGYGNIFKTYNNAHTYKPIYIESGYYKALDFEGNEGLCVSYNGIIQHSKNKGESWGKIDKKGTTLSAKNKLEDVDINSNTAIICGQNGTLYKLLLTNKNIIELKHNFNDANFYSVYLNSNAGFLGGEGVIYRFEL